VTADDLRYRLCAFFAANPDEELTIEDVCVKYDVAPSEAHNARRLIPPALVTTERRGRIVHLVAGPELKQ